MTLIILILVYALGHYNQYILTKTIGLNKQTPWN